MPSTKSSSIFKSPATESTPLSSQYSAKTAVMLLKTSPTLGQKKYQALFFARAEAVRHQSDESKNAKDKVELFFNDRCPDLNLHTVILNQITEIS